VPPELSDDSDCAWLIVGRAGKPHGVHGDILVDIITDFPERLGDGFHHVHRVRYHKGRWLLSVRDIRDRDVIEGWRGRYLFLPEQMLDELPDGYYYEHHLVGLECRSPASEPLGRVIGLDPGVRQSRLVVRTVGGRERLVPFVPEIVPSVDLEAGVVVIDAPRGLLDDDAIEAP
jgi:16S rRNA processing protein RimM